MTASQTFLPFFNDDGSLDELSSTFIKPRNEEEYDQIIAELNARDIEYCSQYDPRGKEGVCEEDWEYWNKMFDPNEPDYGIEILM